LLRGHRFEPVVLALVAVSALSTVNLAGPQDRTRYELTRHIVLYHTLTVEPGLFDRAVFAGRTYSDKAPGMSLLALPAYEAERLAGIARAPRDWSAEGDLSLWLLRLLTSGVLFLVAVFLVGRVAEGLSPATGAATAATFGVATLAAPLAPTLFEHDAAGAFAFAAFVLVWRGRRSSHLALAGLCAGVAVLFQYAAALAALAIGVYCAGRTLRRFGWFLLGALPPAFALGAYDRLAFGSPFHLSYRYVANRFAERQHHGFFGIGFPTLDGLRETLVGSRGLLITSPVCAAAVVGLALLWRRGHRAEAATAAGIAILFVMVEAGYFLPYGGTSPGPRFLGPALPFLALGLPPAFERFPRTTLGLALASAVLTAANSLTWTIRGPDARSWLPTVDELGKTVWAWLGADRTVGAALVAAAACGALVIAALPLVRRSAAAAAHG
jgi:hypothetical protein